MTGGSIHIDVFLPHPPEKVWRALTDRHALASWLMPNDFEARVGHRFTFHADPLPARGFDGVIHCQVLTLEPPERLCIRWRAGDLDTTVTWQLVAQGSGTRLLLRHEGFDGAGPANEELRRLLGGGWEGHLTRRLAQLLDGGPSRIG